MTREVTLIGAPTDVGAGTRGASMGPEALRVAGLGATLANQGVHVEDHGNLAGPANPWQPALGGYRHLPQVTAWSRAVHDAVHAELARERLPIVLGGDMNTWTEERLDAVRELGSRLSLTELTYPQKDLRSLFLGKQLDHIFVRGLGVTKVEAIVVQSSDHNPVFAVLRYPP